MSWRELRGLLEAESRPFLTDLWIGLGFAVVLLGMLAFLSGIVWLGRQLF